MSDSYQPVRVVVCAANRFPDGTIILGARHWDRLMREHAKLLEVKGGREEQGFIDQGQVFMTREEAWVVANAANQIVRRVGGDEGCLYSENLY
jgi:hypothetical protein